MHYQLIALFLGFTVLGEISEGSWISICTALVTLGTLFIKMISDAISRKQDRLDRIELQKLTIAKAEEIKAEATKRESRIIAKVDEAAVKADAAFVAGNGNQEKFAAVQSTLEEHAKALSVPAQVEIVNDPSHPVPVSAAKP